MPATGHTYSPSLPNPTIPTLLRCFSPVEDISFAEQRSQLIRGRCALIGMLPWQHVSKHSVKMANIDKKLAKKLAKMPEEERQAFLENLRQQEEENRRKKEELLARFLRVGLLATWLVPAMFVLHCRISWRRRRRWKR